jgi:hypothetical protein
VSDENEARDTPGRVTHSAVDPKTRGLSADKQSSCDDDQICETKLLNLSVVLKRRRQEPAVDRGPDIMSRRGCIGG